MTDTFIGYLNTFSLCCLNSKLAPAVEMDQYSVQSFHLILCSMIALNAATSPPLESFTGTPSKRLAMRCSQKYEYHGCIYLT
jgi:hypothetical protein